VLVKNEPPPLLFIGQSTGTRSETPLSQKKRSETPQGWPLGLMGECHVEAQDQPTQGRFGRPQVGPTRGVLPLGGFLWVLKSVPGVHMFLRRFRCSGGPMDPCEVHVSRSDSSGLASLGLVTWHVCVAPEVA
jgi:hypothetical protein